MRYLMLFLLVVLAFSSCSSYEYFTLSSSQVPKNEKKEFIWENDTMRLVYNFHGEGGPMSLTVYNKTDKPLFVNWNKSALIRDGHATGLLDSRLTVTGDISSTTPSRSRLQNTTYSLAASVDLPQGMDLVPPASDITKGLVPVWEAGVISQRATDSARQEKTIDKFGVTQKFKRFSFEESQSPLQFTSYLTFILGNNNTTEFFIRHSFYAKEVLVTSSEPIYFSFYRPEGDKLFIKRPPEGSMPEPRRTVPGHGL